MVRSEARLERSVVHDGAYVGQGVRLLGTVVGRNSDLRAGARCEDGVVLGDECFIGEQAVIGSGVKVYPYKTVEAGAVVNQSLVWESRGSRTLFGKDGISGLANVDITPELVTRVAMAYATTLKKGATVTTSRDSSRSARMLKRAIMAGLNASGVSVDDLEVAPVPVTRFQVRSQHAQGGITVRLVAGDPQSVVIRFFDDLGTDISEAAARKIERTFYREDFRRVFPAEIGDIGFPPRTIEYYTNALMQSVDTQLVRRAGFKVVVDYAYGTSAFVMPTVLAKLGAEVLAVNPYASTSGALAYEATAHAQAVADLVRSSGAHVGVVIDPDGEHVTFIDDDGHVLTHTEAVLAFVSLLGETTDPGCRVAVPIAAPTPLGALAEGLGMEVLWTKLSTPALMASALSDDIAMAASLDGGYIFPGFLPAYDGMVAFATMLELLARTGNRLSKLVSSLPRTHVAHETVATPSEHKGAVMRALVETATDQLVLVDGVKMLHDDGWTLVLPDPEEPISHVWAEGESDGEARRRAQDQVGRIRRLMR
jgi:mannose-1-phosphate guanylyltransferase / phosphomannomutase